MVKHNHAIIHTSREPPEASPQEHPNVALNERAMLQPVRVVSNRKTDTMESRSRVDFGKIYTVEHNVKVYDFGRVHETQRTFFKAQFNYVWGIKEEVEEKDEGKEQVEKKKRDRHSKEKKPAKVEKTAKAGVTAKDSKSSKDKSVTTEEAAMQTATYRYVRALCTYNDPMQGCLHFSPRDVILLTGQTSEGWWTGRNMRTNAEGVFPPSYVEEVES